MAETRPPSSNIYTVLVFIALVMLIAGVAYVWFRTYQLTGEINPFQIGESAMRAIPGAPSRLA